MLHTRDSNQVAFHQADTPLNRGKENDEVCFGLQLKRVKERCIIPFHFTRLKILNHVGMHVYT